MGIETALIAGGGSLLGGLFSGFGSYSAAQEQTKFQDLMSRTQYQRAVEDMKAAGLNPMLAYSQGGNSVPSGASYSIPDPISPAVHSGLAAYNKKEENALLEKQIEVQDAQKGLITSQIHKTNSDAAVSANTAMGIHLDNQKKASEEPYYERGASLGVEAKSLANTRAVQEIDQVIQQIKTGQASAAQSYAQIEQLKQMTMNLKLDAAEKQAMAKLWDRIGEAGAAGKVALPMLQILKSILGGK